LHFETPTPRTGMTLAALALALFFTHVVPFGVLCIGFAAMFPYGGPGRIRAAAPLGLAIAVCLRWTLFTEAGRIASGAGAGSDPSRSLGAAAADLSNWFVSAFADGSDGTLSVAFGVIVAGAMLGSMGEPDASGDAARRYALVPLVCVVLYFVLPASHGYL